MTKWHFLALVPATLLLSATSYAQQEPKALDSPKSAACERYKMRIVEPDSVANLAKTPEVQPDARFEYKGKVIDPCAQSELKAVKSPPRLNDKPKPQPLLKLNPESEKKLLSPAEMLKKLNQPAAPKPKS